MKKLLLVIAAVAMMLPSCKKINEELDALGNRIDKLETEAIPSIDEQISAINTTLGNLDAMDKELKGYIDNLTATASSLQERINATNTKIEEVKTALQSEISTAKSEVLAQLATAKTELENELAQINATIETLKEKDEELDKKIAELRSYVDTALGETTDWVNATFATLEQYNALVAEIATIKEQIKAINQSITDLETRITTKINEDIANAVSTLNADIQHKVKDITDAYTTAIKSAKEEITAAYTSAIQNAINALDVSLKAWVGEQLANYYTIAEVEAKITALQTAITEGDATLQEELSKLKSQLETTATEITAAYKKAIEEAINTNNGVIDTKIANEIASVNQRIANEVATINAKIAEIESRLDNVEAKIAELLARIQSISYIPTYSDGKATVKYNGNTSHVTLDFEVSPKDAVVELAKVWQSAVSVKAIYTQTRAVSFIDMPIISFEADATNGVISVTASGENLSAEFFARTQSASVRLSISDGNNSVVSEYVPMIIEEIPNNEIWYTSSDGNIITPSATNVFCTNIISNTYEDGIGIIRFDWDVTSIGNYAFRDCTSLTSITIPDSVASIGESAFRGCTSLTSVTIPDSVTSIGWGAFYGCTSLTSITIPDSVTSIGNYAFRDCTSLTSVTIPNSVTSTGDAAFYGCTSLTAFYGKFASADNLCLIVNGQLKSFAIGCGLTQYTISDSVTSIGMYALSGCTSLTSITIPDVVTRIGSGAFRDCTSLTSVYCKPTTPPTISNSTFENVLECKIYVPDTSIDTYKAAKYWSDLSSNIVGKKFNPANNEIWYTSSDGNIVTPYETDVFGANIISNTYEDGIGIIRFDGDVTSIGNYALSSCSSLTSVTIPNSVTEIGWDAFSGCTSLTSVTIPNSVTEIGICAFSGCTSLTSVYCKPTTPPEMVWDYDANGEVYYGQFAEGVTIYVLLPYVDTYKRASGWSNYANNIVGY